MRKVIAVDFDGCIVKNEYPDIGEPNINVITELMQEQKNGTALILWTCREGKELKQAVNFCKGLGLTFDAVNENLPERVALFGNDSRKIGADEYWDDKAVRKGDKKMSEARPIDAEFMSKQLKDYFLETIDRDIHEVDVVDTSADLQKIIGDIPTLDYAPVIHAKWELTTIFPSGIREYKCSKCGRKLSFFPADGTFHTIKEKLREYPYCNCGAKMDLGDDNK